VTTFEFLGNFLRRNRLQVSVFRQLDEPHSTAMRQRAQMLASSERINVAGDHLKNVEGHPAAVFYRYIRQFKKKLRNSLPNFMKCSRKL
jgi:hypothetical protein